MRSGAGRLSWLEADQAVRDILFLYRDITGYRAIVGDHDTGSFNPWRCLDCTLEGAATPDAAELLHQGSAVALLSEMIDWWTQGGGANIWVFRTALEQGRFDHVGTARAAVEAGLAGESPMIPHLDAVYDEYVLGCFDRLARAKPER